MNTNISWPRVKKLFKGIAIITIILASFIIIKDEVHYQLGLFGITDDNSSSEQEATDDELLRTSMTKNIRNITTRYKHWRLKCPSIKKPIMIIKLQ